MSLSALTLTLTFEGGGSIVPEAIIEVPMADLSGGASREVQVDFNFTGTEIRVQARFKDTVRNVLVNFNKESASSSSSAPLGFRPNGGDSKENKNVLKVKYNKFAGISAISQQGIAGLKLDKFHNAEGNEYDLGKDGAFTDYTVLIVEFMKGYCSPPARQALRVKGFTVHLVHTEDEGIALMPDAHVVWVISYSEPPSSAFVDAVLAHHKRGSRGLPLPLTHVVSGRGLMLWGENAPAFGTANGILARLPYGLNRVRFRFATFCNSFRRLDWLAITQAIKC